MEGLGPIFVPFPFPTSQSFIAVCSVFIYSALSSTFDSTSCFELQIGQGYKFYSVILVISLSKVRSVD